MTITRTDTLRVRDTVFVDRPAPAPPPRVDTVRLAPPPPPVRTAFFGVQGGAGFPLSATKNGGGTGAAARIGYNVGPQVFAMLGVNAPRGPLGFRIDGGYGLLRAQNIGNGYSAGPSATNAARPDLAIYSGSANLLIRARFTRDTLPGDFGSFYIFGGGGAAHVRSFLQSDVAPNVEQNITRPLLNGGAGLEFGSLGAGKIFVEGRYVYIFTPGQKISYVPVGLGVRF